MNIKQIKTKIRVIRCMSQCIEQEIQDFMDSLNQNPVQIIDIKIHGEPLNNHLVVITILWQG